MSIEAENLDSLRKLVRELQAENTLLKKKLKKANITYSESCIFEEKIENTSEFDPDQGGRIIRKYITEEMANRYFAMFWGRTDVYAKRGKNGGYFPQCNNRWNDRLCPKQQGEKIHCEDCKNTSWTKLTAKKIVEHLLGYKDDGSDVIGVYPLLPDGTCRFIVFDFDNHEKGAEETDFANVTKDWHKEVEALRLICEKNGITPLVERSRSGQGAHVWIFFKKPIPASLARNFGYLLLDRGQSLINMKSFQYYDRMYPCQDSANSIGNLIALPLQGGALKNGNSAFIDSNWNAYPDQWDILLNHTMKLSMEEIEAFMEKWKAEITEATGVGPDNMECRPKPWKKKQVFNKSDVVGKMHIILGDGVYVDALNLMPRIQNQIRSLAAFDNPIFYKNRRLGYSNYYNFSAVYMGKDIDGYIRIPRGLREQLINNCKEAGIEYDISDQREMGRPIKVFFNGDLRTEQDLAADKMLQHDHGVLSATTAFGKTVVCSYLISQRKVSTLILLHSKDLIEQWVEELNKFLIIKEKPPIYKTKTGREKQRDSVIGVLTGNKNTLTGIIDVAMIGSMYSKGNFNDFINSYGLVIMDECHHCGSNTSIEVMQRVNSRYVYGVSATPKRGDNLEKIVYMLLGPIRHSYTAKERAKEQGIGHYVYPRFTRVIDTNETMNDINTAYNLISSNKIRNEMIVNDIRQAIADGRTPLILTRYKEHAKNLFDILSGTADYVFLFYGDNSDSENSEIRKNLKKVPNEKSIILIATGQKIGEGFDFPRLDTLMLAAPVSFDGRLEQYVGRLHRDYEGKKYVVVYDYIDAHLKVFEKMYLKRLRTYKRLGYSLISNRILDKQVANAIYDSGNYIDIFERDIIEAEKRIIISSPHIVQERVDRIIYITKQQVEAGCKIVVITIDPEKMSFGSINDYHEMINQMKTSGIQVVIKDEVDEHFAVIDEELVWHGGMNLLGKEDVWDNLIRIKSAVVAEELLELSFGN